MERQNISRNLDHRGNLGEDWKGIVPSGHTFGNKRRLQEAEFTEKRGRHESGPAGNDLPETYDPFLSFEEDQIEQEESQTQLGGLAEDLKESLREDVALDEKLAETARVLRDLQSALELKMHQENPRIDAASPLTCTMQVQLLSSSRHLLRVEITNKSCLGRELAGWGLSAILTPCGESSSNSKDASKPCFTKVISKCLPLPTIPHGETAPMLMLFEEIPPLPFGIKLHLTKEFFRDAENEDPLNPTSTSRLKHTPRTFPRVLRISLASDVVSCWNLVQVKSAGVIAQVLLNGLPRWKKIASSAAAPTFGQVFSKSFVTLACSPRQGTPVNFLNWLLGGCAQNLENFVEPLSAGGRLEDGLMCSKLIISGIADSNLQIKLERLAPPNSGLNMSVEVTDGGLTDPSAADWAKRLEEGLLRKILVFLEQQRLSPREAELNILALKSVVEKARNREHPDGFESSLFPL